VSAYPSSKYSVELANPAGQVLAELGGRAANRSFTVTRNAADDIEWYLNIDEIEKYCHKTYTDPRTIFVTNQTNVRIKRLGQYFAAGQLNYKYGTLAENSSGNLLQIKAAGFYNLLTTAFTGPGQTYTATDASAIAWDLINTFQTGGNDTTGTLNTTTGKYSGGLVPTSYWNLGITQGSLATVGNHDRVYNNMALSDALTDFANTNAGSFDFKFDYLNRFNTYTILGSQRPDILFEYPGNIIEVDAIEDGTQVFNQIIAQGSGNGTTAQNIWTAPNPVTGTPAAASMQAYGVRQQYVSPSSLDVGDSSLQDYANWNLALYQSPLVLPSIIIDGSKPPYITDFSMGDWVHVRVRNHPLYNDINGMYRVEQVKVQIDDNDFEQVTITTSLN